MRAAEIQYRAHRARLDYAEVLVSLVFSVSNNLSSTSYCFSPAKAQTNRSSLAAFWLVFMVISSCAIGVNVVYLLLLTKIAHQMEKRVRGSLHERFWTKVDRVGTHGPNGNCWRWMASLTPTGRAQIAVGGAKGGSMLAARVAYEMANGPIDASKHLLNTCGNGACVNPAHWVAEATEASAEKRFFKRVEKTTDCWLWRGGVTQQGYGQFTVGYKYYPAHKFSYEVTNGPVGKGMVICHKCDNPLCVNPTHLFVGTQADNMRDMILKGRHRNQVKTHCSRGHEYNTENTLTSVGGKRDCRICIKIRRAKRPTRAELRALQSA